MVLWVSSGRMQSQKQTLPPFKTQALTTTLVLGFAEAFQVPVWWNWMPFLEKHRAVVWHQTASSNAGGGHGSWPVSSSDGETQAACPDPAAPAASCFLPLLASYTNYFVRTKPDELQNNLSNISNNTLHGRDCILCQSSYNINIYLQLCVCLGGSGCSDSYFWCLQKLLTGVEQ